MTSSLQVELLAGSSVAAGQPIIFNHVVSRDGSITYNDQTGQITFREPGKYIVNWCVATQSALQVNAMVFALYTSQSDHLPGTSPNKTGTVLGTAVINVATAPVTMTLQNDSNATVYYPTSVPLKATLVIFTQNPGVPTEDNSFCFCIAQLVNILQQLILLYPLSLMSVYTTSLRVTNGTPFLLYTSPEGQDAGLFIMLDENGQHIATPIDKITAVYTGDGTVYNPSIVYITPPAPLPPGCDTDLMTAVHDYLPLGSTSAMYLGPAVVASGQVYKNEYGIIVLSDNAGNTPVFIPINQIVSIINPPPPPPSAESDRAVTISKVTM